MLSSALFNSSDDNKQVFLFVVILLRFSVICYLSVFDNKTPISVLHFIVKSKSITNTFLEMIFLFNHFIILDSSLISIKQETGRVGSFGV